MRPRLHRTLLLCCILTGCGHSAQWKVVRAIEAYMEARPQMALTALKAIDADELKGRREKAEYALMMSMALDKNYVDTTSFDILQPAIDYYPKHGSPTERLRTYYCQGRIYENREDDNAALACFLKGQEAGLESDDILTKALTLSSQAKIYYTLTEWEKSKDAYLAAAKVFKEARLINYYGMCLTRAADCCTQAEDMAGAADCLTEARGVLPKISAKYRSGYYSAALLCSIRHATSEEIRQTIADYAANVPEQFRNRLTLAYAYEALGDYDNALALLNDCQVDRDIEGGARQAARQRLDYYALCGDLSEKTGKFEEALSFLKRHRELNDSLQLAAYREDTRFAEERHSLEMEAAGEQHKKERIAVICALIAIAAVVALRMAHNQLKIKSLEKDKLELLYSQATEELQNLTELVGRSEPASKEVKEALAERMRILNLFVTGALINSSRKSYEAEKKLNDMIADKEGFLESTRLALEGSHPRFINHLREKGLSLSEINCCCLYAIGLNGKEVGAYVHQRGHYNVSSAIREKLGIGEHETNLGIYLRRLVAEMG